MEQKVVLVLVDGMRPDGMLQCGQPFVNELISKSTYCLKARTVVPSVTLPCHMSLFHSVDPERHGILTNTYVPQVRPVTGLFDRLETYDKKCAFFYSWEELRDLSRPDHLHTAICLNQHYQVDTDIKLTDMLIPYLHQEKPDFTFLYLGETDEVGGHDCGWMSEQYLKCINKAFTCIEKLYNNLPEGYTMIVCADHGGHDKTHGDDIPEDMTIPVLFTGPKFKENFELAECSIKDIAVTVADLLEVPTVKEWEGVSRA